MEIVLEFNFMEAREAIRKICPDFAQNMAPIAGEYMMRKAACRKRSVPKPASRKMILNYIVE